MMRAKPYLFRLSASVAIGALLCNSVLPNAAFAQSAPPPPTPQAAQPDQNQADPPARVGRIAAQSGAVSFRTNADTQWSAARLNYPVSSGNSFWTEPTAQAELQISASRIDLAGQTQFDVVNLLDSGLQAVAGQGEVVLQVANLMPDEVWAIQTPRGEVRISQPGTYDINVGNTQTPTVVTVVQGEADIQGPGVSLKVAANQTATIGGAGASFDGKVDAIQRDAFLSARLAANHPPGHPPASIAAQLPYMSGGVDLYTYGEWSTAADYGDVWYPPVSTTWVPYQDGQWAYVAPWGWTWVDAEPWGFAPFHYGRWARIDNRWGWIPGDAPRSDRAVYAPALVAFIGVGAGVAVGAALAHGMIGWVPLGPNEPYHPWYHASSGYLSKVNTGYVKDPRAIGNTIAINNFANRAAATQVPANVMLSSHRVLGAGHVIPERALASAHPVSGPEQLPRPTPTTFGVTPAVAHEMNLSGGAASRPAPGPIVHASGEAQPNGAFRRPELLGPHGEQPAASPPGSPAEAGRPPGAPPPAAHPENGPAAGPGRPGEVQPGHPEAETHPNAPPEANRPGGGTPPLPAPGERPPGVEATRPGEPTPPRAEQGRPEEHAAPGPENHPPVPENREARPAEPPREGPRPEAPPARVEAPRPEAPPPHVEAPRPEAPPPRVEAPRPEAPPPRVEAPRQAPPPRVEAPPPRAEPPPPSRAEAPPRPAAPPPPHPAAPPPHGPEKKPG
jgi:hypothetical protein